MDSEKTVTSVQELPQPEAIEELVRLIGGAKITAATKQAAEEMKDMARLVKVEL